MEALAIFIGWSLLIALGSCVGIFAVVGTYIGCKACFNEFRKGEMKYHSLHQANEWNKSLSHQLEDTTRMLQQTREALEKAKED